MNKTIRNINDLASLFGATPDNLERTIYKGTSCGAWIQWNCTSVSIGSIVEGSDAEFSCKFSYPFESTAVFSWLDELDRLTTTAWNEANADDPYDIVMNMTDPGLELTHDQAEELISQAEANGWTLPIGFDADMFLEIYEDCEPEEEDD